MPFRHLGAAVPRDDKVEALRAKHQSHVWMAVIDGSYDLRIRILARHFLLIMVKDNPVFEVQSVEAPLAAPRTVLRPPGESQCEDPLR